MRYEYAITYHNAPIASLESDAGEDVFAALKGYLGLQVLNTVIAWTDAHEGGGWELVSHSVAVVKDQILISFVARRPLE